ncbi:MAG: PAS domain S-box protein [Rhodobacteraceae bacterium]|nr:PAS domain S-box protein [Paracoccaceae bacterium]
MRNEADVAQPSALPGVTGPGAGAERAAHFALVLAATAVFNAIGLVLKPDFATLADISRGIGVALAMLFVFGRGYWIAAAAGILLSRTLLLNLTPEGLSATKFAADALLAILTGGQAALGVTLARHFFGWPIRLRGWRDLAGLVLLLGPLLCMLGAAGGIGIALAQGKLAASEVQNNGLAWWLGDMVGMAVSLPVVSLWPSRHPSFVIWRFRPVPRFSGLALTFILTSLVVTSVSWEAINATITTYNQAQFARLAGDARHAFLSRIAAYSLGLDAAKGLMQASDRVSLADWRAFTAALQLPIDLKGVNGIGFIEPVPRDGMAAFMAEAQADGVTGLQVHPATNAPESFIVKYIEPLDSNRQAVGLNIAFEPFRAEAAEAARDTGEIRVTRPLTLVQDTTAGPAFLVLMPVYRPVLPLETTADRRAALRGWVYMPFVGDRLLDNLTSSQRTNVSIRAFDGPTNDPTGLIYASPADTTGRRAPRFRVEDHVAVFGRTWTLVWESTPKFEAGISTAASATTLASGLAFTLLLAVFLLSVARREDEIQELVAKRTRELSFQVEENRSIIQTSIAIIVLLDEQGRILFANEAATRLFGYQSDELVGRPLSWLLDGATTDYFLHEEGGGPRAGFRGEVRTSDRSDRVVLLDLQVNAWDTVDGRRRYTALMNDVTDKRQVEQQLQDTQARLDIALTGAKIGVFDIDLRTGKSIVSATWKSLFGFPVDAELDAQQEWLNRIHPEDLARVQEADQACIDGRAARSISEYRSRGVDGAWRWMRSEAVAGAHDAEGRATRLIGVQTNITELVQSKEDLRTSEAQFRSAIEYAPIGMGIAGLDGRLIQVNDALGRFAGETRPQMIGRKVADLLRPDARARIAPMIRRLLVEGEKSFEIEARCERKGFGEVWGRFSVAVVRDSQGHPLNLVVQIQDITEQKEVDRLKNEFIATVSHELRTPLTSINGSLGLVLNSVAGDLSDLARRMLSIAQTNCSRLILLVNDLLDIEKLVAGQMSFDLVSADIGQLALLSVRDNQPLADTFAVRLVASVPHEPCYCRVDVNRFQQVLANLLSNAVKFSPSGDPVEVVVRQAGESVTVEVTDHGPGVPAAFRGKIFQPFSQADSSASRANGGTGLGLNISRRLVEEMGGSIGFTSVPDEATTFWVTLPAAPADRAQGAAGRR